MKMMNYAKALHQIAVKNDTLDTISYQFEAFRDYMNLYPSWVKMMDSPMLTVSKKHQNIDQFEYDGSFLAFLKVLAKNNELNLYQAIYEQWLYLAREHQKIAHIHLYSAKPISDEEIKKLKDVLAPRFPGKTIAFRVSIDESLLGGIKTVYQGQSLDRSIAKEVEELYITI